MLSDLIEYFSRMHELPIKIEDIASQINAMGIQDEIYIFQADTNPTKVRGGFHQFTYSKGVYADPQRVTHIVCSKNVPLEWRRVICAKELVHIFDTTAARTSTKEEASQLLDRLVGPLSSEDYGLVDLQAAQDRLALYQSLPLLMPNAALSVARDSVARNLKTIEDVSRWACMPIEFVRLMLSDEWKDVNGVLGRV